jgi:RNA polymerase sigma factor (sigma-70 family)
MALADAPVHLIQNARNGDATAIEELMMVISPDLYRIIFSMLRDHDDTDEVLQESLLRVFRYLKKLKDCGRFTPWTIRIAVNQVHTFRMKRGKNRFYTLEEEMEPEEGAVILNSTPMPDPCDAASRNETRAQIIRAMKALPNRQQTAIMLFELEGLTIRDIAKVMDCSEGAVKFNIHEARQKLQRTLETIAREQVPGIFQSRAEGS